MAVEGSLKPVPATETVYVTRVETVRGPALDSEPTALFDRQVRFYDFALKAAFGFLTFIGVFFSVVGALGLRDIRRVRATAKASANEMVKAFGTDVEKLRAALTDKVNAQTGNLVAMAGRLEAEMRKEMAETCARLKVEAQAQVGAATEKLVAEAKDDLSRTKEDLKARFQAPPPATEPARPTKNEKEAFLLIEQAGRARAKKDYRKAVETYSEALKLNPASSDAYSGRGYAQAMRGQHGEAAADFGAAARLKPDSHGALHNCGTALFRLARLQSGDEAIATFKQACDKYKRATEIDPDFYASFDDWAAALISLYRLVPEKERPAVLAETRRVLDRGRNKPGSSDYNLACLEAIEGKTREALRLLETELSAGRVTAEYAEKDVDFADMKEDRQFKALIEKYRKRPRIPGAPGIP